jgi:4,4'-diaponeurosporenoate glycosyltransferase
MGPELILLPIGTALWLASFGLLRRLSGDRLPISAGASSAAEAPSVAGASRSSPFGGRLAPGAHEVSLIIPARNEAHNLPRLLDSIRAQPAPPLEVLVVDDGSTDATASVATAHGATVIPSLALPDGWRGKPWALHQGALAAKGELLLFLDADCWLEPGGLDAILAAYEGGAFSVAPYHAVQKPYEELSAFFNLIMVASTTGHGLFGQMLLIDRNLYEKTGGHQQVKGRVLENLRLAGIYRAAGVPVASQPGRGMLAFRMYPEGLSSLVEGWTKGFASGASETPRSAVILVALWISGLMIALIALPFSGWSALLYLAFALQFGLMLKRVGSFSWLTALGYPVSLAFYLAVFVRSQRRSGKAVTWKGREFRAD